MELMPDKAYRISSDGSISETAPANGRTFSLSEAQRVVDGYIEIVHLDDKRIMVVNEEGKFGKTVQSDSDCGSTYLQGDNQY